MSDEEYDEITQCVFCDKEENEDDYCCAWSRYTIENSNANFNTKDFNNFMKSFLLEKQTDKSDKSKKYIKLKRPKIRDFFSDWENNTGCAFNLDRRFNLDRNYQHLYPQWLDQRWLNKDLTNNQFYTREESISKTLEQLIEEIKQEHITEGTL